jgi:mevalonate kinase
MKKNELLKNFEHDFTKSRGALAEIIENNRIITSQLMHDLSSGDFKRIEEFVMLNQMVLDGVKASNDLYKQAVDILKNVEKLPEKNEEKKTSKIDELMKALNED